MKQPEIISRNQAAELWGPLDQRLQVDGELGSEPTFLEALAVTRGMNDDEDDLVYPYTSKYSDQEMFFDGKLQCVLDTGNQGFIDILQTSQRRQQVDIAQIRQKAAEDLLGFLGLLGQAVVGLANDGLLTAEQAEQIQGRFFDEHGNPTLADMPVSMLEYHKLAMRSTGGKALPDQVVPYVDYQMGAVISPRDGDYYDDLSEKNKTHEAGHAWIGGVEIMIGANTAPSVVDVGATGSWAYEQVDNNFKNRGFKSNEGTTDLFESALRAHQPGLQAIAFDDVEGSHEYIEYRDTIGRIRTHNPELFRAVINEYIAEPTSSQPDLKLEARERRRELMQRSDSLPAGVIELFE